MADAAELPCGVPGLLRRFGASVEIAQLTAGDYRVGGGALVERKSVRDLHHTLRAGRLFRQLGDIRTSCRSPFLLVEGSRLDAGPLGQNAIRGALLTAFELGVMVLRSEDHEDSALWLYRLAARRQRSSQRTRPRPLYAQRPKARVDHTPEAILAAVPSVSTHSARTLLRHFGSVERVFNATYEELQRVPGIGPVRAESLLVALRKPHSTYHSRPSRE